MSQGPTRAAAAPVTDPATGVLPGLRLLQANRWFTYAFVAWSLVAVLARPTRLVFAALDLGALIVGSGVYLVAYANAVSRSRVDAIGLGGLFFLADGAGPPAVRRSFWLYTTVQTAVALAAAAVRPFTPVAFGVLVPIVGLSLMGLWGARHGHFEARDASPRVPADDPAANESGPSTRAPSELEQNEPHG